MRDDRRGEFAVDCTDQTARLELLLREIVERNENILSAAIRRQDGELLAQIGNHQQFWKNTGTRSTANEVLVPILAASRPLANAGTAGSGTVPAAETDNVVRWGNVELRFAPVSADGIFAFLYHPWAIMSFAVSVASGPLFYFYLRRMLRHLDPTKAVPQRVRAALDSLAEGLLVLDHEERIVLANQAFASWVGVEPDQLTGLPVSALDWQTHQANDVSEDSTLPWTDALRLEKAQAAVMLTLQQQDGVVRNLMANASPVLGHDGRYGGVLVSFDDVTQLEETRRDLNQAMHQAEEANRAKSEFLARMSHEIRTPMNAILGYTEVLRDGFNEDDAAARRSYLDTIHASGEHLLALINDILDLSKIESGRMELDVQRHSVRELMNQVMRVMDVRAQEKGIDLRLEAAGPVPEFIYTDAVRFRQALFNLVGNAVKFTDKGSVRVVVGMARDHRLQVEVIDTGVGIAEDALDKVFERFTQADASVGTKFGGTGLGLSISRQLARMMGGDIVVASEPGRGSTFTLTVDPGDIAGTSMFDETSMLTAPNTEHQAHASRQRLPENCRILVVDDEPANRRLAGIYISRAGGSFAEACNGQEALDITKTEQFDVILMDFNMPVMGGLDATRALRSRGLETPVIALTANVMQDDKDAAAAAGCNGFLTKPLKSADLVRTIAELLSRNCKTEGQQEPLAQPDCPPAGSQPSAEHASDSVPAVPLPSDARSGSAECEANVLQNAGATEPQPSGAGSDSADSLIESDPSEGIASETSSDAQTFCPDRPRTRANDLCGSLDTLLSSIDRLLETDGSGRSQGTPESGEAITQRPQTFSDDGPADRQNADHQEPAASEPVAPLESTLPTEDPEFYEIVAGFPPKLRSQVAGMREAFEKGDFVLLKDLSHWLAGTGETLGFPDFTVPARTLEAAARDGLTDQMLAPLQTIEQLSQRVVVRKPVGVR